MSNLVNHARAELERLLPADSNPGDPGYEVNEDGKPDVLNGMNDHMRADILQLVMVFANQNHSGMSGSYVLGILPKLLDFKNLTPLTDDPAEWNEVGPKVWQSRRCGEAFSNDGGRTYYLLSERDDKNVMQWHTWEPNGVTR